MQQDLEIGAVIGFSGMPLNTQGTSTTACSCIPTTNTSSTPSDPPSWCGTSSPEPKASCEATSTTFPVGVRPLSNQNFKRRTLLGIS